MHVYSSNKFGSFRDKKNSIIRHGNTPYATPIKNLIQNAYTNQTSEKKVITQTITHSDERQIRELPANALMKKCFQKSRRIKSICQLQPMYETQILSKSNYRYKANESKSIKSNKTTSSFLRKKSIIDKIPTNIFALQSSMLNRSHKSSMDSRKSRRYFSQSKLIKNGIIRYD